MATRIDSPARFSATAAATSGSKPQADAAQNQTLETLRKVIDFSISAFEFFDPKAKAGLEQARKIIDGGFQAVENQSQPQPAPVPLPTPKPAPKPTPAPQPSPKPSPKPKPAPAPKPAPKPQVPTAELRRGNHGAQVKQLQQDLVKLGYMTQAQMNTGPGTFGPRTQAAVEKLQSAWHLEQDGVYGPKTRAALTQALAGEKPPKGPPPAPQPAPGKPGGWKPGPGKLYGADTSHWQSDGNFQKSIQGSQFAMVKATEGTGYVDPTFHQRWNELGQRIQQGKMTMRVGYLFLDPGNGAAQAKHFLDTVGVHGKLPAGTRLALDWEGAALSSPQTLRDAANYIKKVTGQYPLIYTSASRMSAAKAAVPNAPMWEAIWGAGVPSNVPFVQYSDGPNWDHDVFNGDLAALRKFAGF